MKQVKICGGLTAPAVIVGCMRLSELSEESMGRLIHTAVENGSNYFDLADVYAQGKSEELFGAALEKHTSLRREDIVLQSKCGIREGRYDFSAQYILSAVDGILKRLRTDYLDVLLLHRPDALVEPEEVAQALDTLERTGKVKYFGVSNHKPMQIELLKKYVRQELVINQLQFSLPVSNMVANGLEVNMGTDGAVDRDGSVLDYCRLRDITIQAWSPFQKPAWKGCFLGSGEYAQLNKEIAVLSEKYKAPDTAIAAAWILRHPAHMQLVTGTSNEKRLLDILSAADIALEREEWYRLYLAAGHILP